MSDDSFIREVEEELRSDRFKALWKRFGPFIIGGAVLVVALTAAWRFYLSYTEGQANASGDRYLEAVELAEAGNRGDALTALEALEGEAAGRYDLLARLRAASLRAADDPAAAIAAYRAVADDGGTPEPIADIARLRAAYLLVDHGEASEVEALVGGLVGPADPMRHSAREALGLAALKAGDLPGAAAQFESLLADQAPPGIGARAETMLAFIRSRGGAAPSADDAPAPAATGSTPDGTEAMPDGTEAMPDGMGEAPDADRLVAPEAAAE